MDGILGSLGIDPFYLFIIMFMLQVALIVLLVLLYEKYNRLQKSYSVFMKGKNGKSLEKSIFKRFEKLVKALKNPKKEIKKPKPEHMFVYNNIEEQMKNIIGTKVSVNPKANGKGRIEIEYYSEQELERIYDLIMTIQSE